MAGLGMSPTIAEAERANSSDNALAEELVDRYLSDRLYSIIPQQLATRSAPANGFPMRLRMSRLTKRPPGSRGDSRSIHKIMGGRDMRHDKPSRTRPTRRAVFKLSGGTALVGALVGIQGLTSSAVSREEQAGGPAIDTHIHVVPASLPGIKPMPEDVDQLYKGPPSEMAARLRVEMRLAKYKIAWLM